MTEADLYKELGALTKDKDRWKESIPYTFAKWMEFHFATCERQDLIGASNHTLDIMKVRK